MPNEKQRLANNKRQKKWRAANKEKVRARRKFLRDNYPTTKIAEKKMYKQKRDAILKRCKEYNEKNPAVKKRAQEKAKKLGKSILKGVKERENLSPAYVASQIRNEKSIKTIEQKQTEILIYRLKKAVKKYE